MSEDVVLAVAAVLAVIFAGIIILVPVLALTIRFALRPVIDSWTRLKQSPQSEQERSLLARRLDLLEAELQQVQHSVKEIAEAQDFQRQLSDRSVAG